MTHDCNLQTRININKSWPEKPHLPSIVVQIKNIMLNAAKIYIEEGGGDSLVLSN